MGHRLENIDFSIVIIELAKDQSVADRVAVNLKFCNVTAVFFFAQFCVI